jgi:glycosyltransferase involved in cell wall biosynthesis
VARQGAQAVTDESMRPMLSVVCPFFNEGPLIEAAVRRMVGNLREQLDASWELILVNDGSTDDGARRLLAMLAELNEPRVRVISYPVNQGRGRALRTGIVAAAGTYIVTTEADCSWGDDIVKRLFDAIRKHPDCDFVVASPHREGGGFVGVPVARVWLTRWGNKLISLFFRAGLTMHTGMTRAYRRDVIAPLRTFENGKEFHLEVLFKLVNLRFHYSEIPATLSWEMRNQFRAPARRMIDVNLLRLIRTHLVLLLMADPLRLFFNAMLGAFGVSTLFFAAAVRNLVTGRVSIFLALLSLFFFLFGLLFIGFAIVLSRLRDHAVENWSRDYPEWPPMRSGPTEIVRQGS